MQTLNKILSQELPWDMQKVQVSPRKQYRIIEILENQELNEVVAAPKVLQVLHNLICGCIIHV